ncbi:NADH:flavin oxidoreductase/NADH oxidase family protein [Bradyrhizobium jicamae]|uniref:NADH:flavin oxidoreductase/NADH oxidase family protein n=1 Tax=Bradyrhizobium jicamae TaxID=280332 RepID=A0ABS5FM72_9BRAD|nr:NADH:flavin oxidoreductase/NADH oxidase family protein [Bradyrhizobium jicamae]MBR0797875.1 NADH:flavin oxidoreductase/NADH oxidase family protein [Bradyrhizobium jicamae]MBR0935930.1 NADH:flavin oxidoreductase/NADH oxidase family protein [Bradyrhizobium jicamae]
MSPFESLTLPNGTVVPNRIAKAAMEENMADAEHLPSAELLRLYQAWADGGAGLIITGNVMIDRRAMTGPGGVVLEDGSRLDAFRDWTRAGRARGAQMWLQLNHPGRQMMKSLGQQTRAPSAVSLDLGKHSNLFATPKAMTEQDIHEVITRFANAAKLGEQAGFSGAQIHAAHGYLISQFLSPLTNRRTDDYGGSLENRARILIETVKAVRAAVSPGFSVAVKLNSADFQRGGFDAADAKIVVGMLNRLPVDLVELSGGSYEAPAMQGVARDGRTLAREAYFLEFARDIAAVAKMPVMVTGGIRRIGIVQKVLDSGVAIAGIGTALAVKPDLPLAWRRGEDPRPEVAPITWKSKPLASLAMMAVVKFQLRRLSRGSRPNPGISPLWALLLTQLRTASLTRKYRRWMTSSAVADRPQQEPMSSQANARVAGMSR